jgi:hypothetical protein
VDPYPDSESGSGSRRAKKCFSFLESQMFSLRASGFFCSLDLLYGGLGIGKL